MSLIGLSLCSKLSPCGNCLKKAQLRELGLVISQLKKVNQMMGVQITKIDARVDIVEKMIEKLIEFEMCSDAANHS